ncbi:hypothetical protein [Streptomyces colonosanans]|uniref:hypothetical protein n=1 Tax=Streptomyces colonosanans TaxID=1428652 RepID=UPI0015A59F05|nr:hypothetical protein [Streptomyces colonosanans]
MSTRTAQQDRDTRLVTGNLAALQAFTQRQLHHSCPGVALLGFGQMFTEAGTDRRRAD